MKKMIGLAAAASVLALSSAADAATLWSFTGNSAKDGAVSGTALISVTGTTLTVDLTNLLANIKSDGQELSGIQIFLDHLPTTTTLTTASGTEIAFVPGDPGSPGKTCAPKAKGCVPVAPTPATPPSTTGDDNVIHHWGTALSGGSVFLATAGTGALGGKPEDLIVGPGPYTDFNASVVGKNPHIQGTGHFVLTFTGLTGTPFVSGVNLAFGTSGTDYHMATCSDPTGGSACTPGGGGGQGGVPEPATWAMMIMGFGGVGAMMRRRRTVFG